MSGTTTSLYTQLPRSWNKLENNPSDYSDYYADPMEDWSSIKDHRTALDPRRGMNNVENIFTSLPKSWNKVAKNSFKDYSNYDTVPMEDWSSISTKRTVLDQRRSMNNAENIFTQLPRSWNKLETNSFNNYSDYSDPMDSWTLFNKYLNHYRTCDVPMNNISKEASAWGSTLPSLLLKYGIPGLLGGGLIYGGYKAYDWWRNRQQAPMNTAYDLYRNYYQYNNPYTIHPITNNRKPKIQADAGVNITSKELSNDVENTTPTNINLTPADAETKAKIRRLAGNLY